MVAMLLKPFSTVLRHVAFMEGSETTVGKLTKDCMGGGGRTWLTFAKKQLGSSLIDIGYCKVEIFF